MSNRIKWILSIVFLTAIIISSCGRQGSETPIPGIDSPIQVEGVQLTVTEAKILNSYSVHYIMRYPQTGKTFYVVTVKLEGFKDPKSALVWGEGNLNLVQAGQSFELEYAHWALVGEEIEYKSNEEFQYRYVFIYSIPLNTDYTLVSLQVSDTGSISLITLIEESEKTTAQTASEPESSSIDAQIIDLFATMSGGSKNTSSAYHTTISGGHLNQASVAYATVGGGRENLAVSSYTTVGGGYANEASGRDSTVGGGSRNIASNYYATVSGGIRNQAIASDATIGGGGYNLASDTYATIGGGTQNEASGSGSVVSGGAGNQASNNQSTVGGGLGNQASGAYATISGGHGNLANGGYSAIPGGLLNQAQGDYSFAGGHRASVSGDHPGVFLFADSVDADFPSERANEFGVRATGGVRFVTAIDEAGESISGVTLAQGSGSWSSLSDRGMKENFMEVNQFQILQAVVDLPISEWNYRSQDASIRHIGPTSQDFYTAFGTGEDESHISSIDADGVSLAAIQGMYQLIKEKDVQIKALESRLERIEMMIVSALCGLVLAWSISTIRKSTISSSRNGRK